MAVDKATATLLMKTAEWLQVSPRWTAHLYQTNFGCGCEVAWDLGCCCCGHGNGRDDDLCDAWEAMGEDGRNELFFQTFGYDYALYLAAKAAEREAARDAQRRREEERAAEQRATFEERLQAKGIDPGLLP